MKIAIYGDSFGDIKKYADENVNTSHAWPHKLAKIYDVDNFAVTGSGLEWSYNLAISNNRHYDKIIFLASHVDRLMVNKIWWPYVERKHINQAANHSGNKFLNQKIIPAAQNYHVYFRNEEFSHNRVNLIYKDLKHRFKNKLLLLKLFNDSNNVKDCNNKLCLFDLQAEEIKQFYGNNCDVLKIFKAGDNRLCHLSNTHHKLLFHKITKWLQNGYFRLTIEDIAVLSNNELGKYFK